MVNKNLKKIAEGAKSEVSKEINLIDAENNIKGTQFIIDGNKLKYVENPDVNTGSNVSAVSNIFVVPIKKYNCKKIDGTMESFIEVEIFHIPTREELANIIVPFKEIDKGIWLTDNPLIGWKAIFENPKRN